MEYSSSDISLGIPTSLDGAALFELVEKSPPLDRNSMYCNLLQCSHFADTCVAAKVPSSSNELVGFISGYILPNSQDTLFVWQVAVSESARGQGLATKMLKHILARPCCSDVSFLETTITDSNEASWKLFEGLANKLGTQLNSETLFDRDTHFSGQHDSEVLVRIGPF